MKDLIQEGRKIQETFKKNVLTEGRWAYVGAQEGDIGDVYEFEYSGSFFDYIGNLLKKISGKLPKIKKITAMLNIDNGEYKRGGLEIKITLGNPIRIEDDFYDIGYVDEFDKIFVTSKPPYSSFEIFTSIQNKKNSKNIDDAEMNKLITQLLNELKPELKKYM